MQDTTKRTDNASKMRSARAIRATDMGRVKSKMACCLVHVRQALQGNPVLIVTLQRAITPTEKVVAPMIPAHQTPAKTPTKHSAKPLLVKHNVSVTPAHTTKVESVSSTASARPTPATVMAHVPQTTASSHVSAIKATLAPFVRTVTRATITIQTDKAVAHKIHVHPTPVHSPTKHSAKRQAFSTNVSV